MEPNTAQDRRRFSRIDFDSQATVHQGARRTPVQLLDISVKGVLVCTDHPDAIDTEPAQLLIELQNGIQIGMQMTLIHRHEQCLGFVCTSIDLDSAAHLRRLIELNLTTPNAAERVLDEMLAAPPYSTSTRD